MRMREELGNSFPTNIELTWTSKLIEICRMSVYVLTLFESNFIAPLIAGWLNDAIGWRWTMRFGAIFAAGAFVVLFFGMEETMYFRHVTEGVQPASHSSAD